MRNAVSLLSQIACHHKQKLVMLHITCSMHNIEDLSASCHLHGSLYVVLYNAPVWSLLFKAATHVESLLELCSALLLTGKKLQLSTNKWPKYLQGTPLTPMDISPQQYTEGPASAPTPPPQPQFTPQAAAPSNPSFQFSFGASSSSDVPKQAGAKHTPKGRKSAAALPRSRFVPPNATDTSTGFNTAFASSAQAQASSASTAGAAGLGTAFGAPAQAQQYTAGIAGFGTTLGGLPQAQPSTAGTAGAAGIGSASGTTAQAQPCTASTAGFGTAQAQPSTAGTAGAAGFGSASGTTAQAQPSTAGTAGFGTTFAQAQPSKAGTAGFAEHSAPRPAAPNGFANPAAPFGFSAFTSAIPFSVPGRPMDSRISDACAMGLFGINLDSTAVQSATAQAAAAPSATAAASAATAGAHPVRQQPPAVPGSYGTSSSFAAGSMEGGSAKSDQPSASSTAFAPQDPFGSRGFFAAPAEGQPPTAGQAAQPSPTPFTMDAGTSPAHHSGRPLFATEHLATNLHDKLVLEEQLAAATQAEAAQAAASHPEHVQPSAADPAPFAAAAAAAANGPAGSASTSSEAAQAQQQAAQQQAAQHSAAGSTSAASAAAPTAAAPPPFIFGSSAAPAANHAAADTAGRAEQSQPQGFLFGTANSFPAQQAAAQPAGGRAAQSQPQGFPFGTARSVPAQQAAAQPTPSQPFVFGASVPSSAPFAVFGETIRQMKDGANFPPAGGSQASWPQAAPFSTASPAAATSEVPLPFASGPVNTNSVRTGLHSPSGVAKHTSSRGGVSGAGQHGRPVPGSPHARRTRPTPRKQPHPQVRAYSKSIQSNLHHECIYNNGSHLSHSLLTIIQTISS